MLEDAERTTIVNYDVSGTVLPRCYAPPPFATYFHEKEEGGGGGGVTMRTCAFTSQLSPPPPRIHVLRSTKLCCAVEDENSFDRHAVAVLKDGRLVGHVHVAIYC